MRKVPIAEMQYNAVLQKQPNEHRPSISNMQYEAVARNQVEPTLPAIADIQYANLNIQNIGPINQFLGVSTLDPFAVKVGYATRIRNLTSGGGAFPSLVTRPGETSMGAAFGSPVTGLALHQGSFLHAVAGGVWRKYNGSTWDTVTTGLSTTAKWSFCNFKGDLSQINLIGVNGVDAARKYDGTSVTTLTGTPAGVIFKVIDQHDNRMYASDGKAVYFSALRKAQDWTTVDDAGSVQIETNTGEDVIAIKGGLKHLMIFKPHAFFELWGTGSHNYRMEMIAETGAIGKNAVTVKDEAAYWIGEGNAYRYTGGLPRSDFALAVRGYFEDMNLAAAANACVTSTNESVLFSIPTGSSTVNNVTLEYFPDFNVWTVWEDFSPTNWIFWNNVLFYGDATGMKRMDSNSSAVTWEWVSPPFSGGSLADRHIWYKLYYAIETPPGSSLFVSVSNTPEGDTGWVEVGNILSSDTPPDNPTRALKPIRSFIPITQMANSNWLRIKLIGTGMVKIHQLDIQQRQMPMT